MENIDYFNNLDKEELKNILKSLPANIFFKDLEGKYVFCSSFLDIDDDIIGKTSLETNEDKLTAQRSFDVDKQIISTGRGTSYVRKITSNGIEKYMEIIKNPVFDENGKIIGISGLVNDITSRILLEEKLKDLANKDDLTGLFNRTYLSYWSRTRNKEELYPLVIFSIDCNDLKYINDNYGHLVGDQYLRNTATLLNITFPKDAVITRVGGDEFIVIIPNSNEKQALEYSKMLKERSRQVKIFNNSLSVATGFSVVDNYISDLSASIDIADKAMYKNKSKVKKLNVKN